MAIKNIPEWARIQQQEIVYDADLVVQYKFNGMDGLYKLGDKSYESLIVQPISYRTRYSQRFGSGFQTWFDFCFVDEQSKVAMMPLKKESANIVMDWISGLLLDGIAPHAVKVVLQSKRIPVQVVDEKTKNTYDDFYYAVLPDEYEFVDEERFKIVSELKARNIRFAPLGEVWNG